MSSASGVAVLICRSLNLDRRDEESTSKAGAGGVLRLFSLTRGDYSGLERDTSIPTEPWADLVTTAVKSWPRQQLGFKALGAGSCVSLGPALSAFATLTSNRS